MLLYYIIYYYNIINNIIFYSIFYLTCSVDNRRYRYSLRGKTVGVTVTRYEGKTDGVTVTRYEGKKSALPLLVTRGKKSALPLLVTRGEQTALPLLVTRGINRRYRYSLRGKKSALPLLVTREKSRRYSLRGKKSALPLLVTRGEQTALPLLVTRGTLPITMQRYRIWMAREKQNTVVIKWLKVQAFTRHRSKTPTLISRHTEEHSRRVHRTQAALLVASETYTLYLKMIVHRSFIL